MSESTKVKHAIDRNVDHGTDLLEEAKERFSDFTEDAKAQGEKLLENVKERGADLWDDAQSQGKGAWKDVKTLIRKNPTEAVGCALIAGALLYAIFSRQGDNS